MRHRCVLGSRAQMNIPVSLAGAQCAEVMKRMLKVHFLRISNSVGPARRIEKSNFLE